VTRVPEPGLEPERAALEGWLDYHRDTLLMKCQGLTVDQLRRRAVPPSTLSLLGLVRHLAEVERSWFRWRLDGEEASWVFCSADNLDGDFDDVDTADPESDFAAYRAEVETVRAVAARYQLDDTFVHQRTGETFDLRWIYLHMIEEYARHNGHADLLREVIDGVTGD
jgi:hypothetical protein